MSYHQIPRAKNRKKCMIVRRVTTLILRVQEVMNSCTSNFLQKHDNSRQVEDPYVLEKMKAKFTRHFQQRVISCVSISEIFFRNIFYRKNSF